ncbi:MAG: class I SAM-dependent methyltransferase [Phycisphaerales bacterium]|nr:class I SAM-dependent methyltransferase [Phycisphaerales bacterium]
MTSRLLTIARFATRFGRLRELVRKVKARLRPGYTAEALEDYRAWLIEHQADLESTLAGADPEGWKAAVAYAEAFDARARKRLSELPVELGGAAHVELLYYLVKRLKPTVVVETGVAAGFSSRAILDAIDENGAGHLYSSDFPYFRLPNPEQYIGVLVDESQRGHWTLMTDGDRANLPRIFNQVDRIDLFSYDSDKSVQGRAYAMKLAEARMHAGTFCVMDDINDNPFFRDYLAQTGRVLGEDALVMQYQNKYVGLIGPVATLLAPSG